jgi:predicted permease
MDTRVLLVCLALSVVSALFCGLAPALQSTRTNLVNGLKSTEVEAPGRKRFWGRNLLVVAQVSLSLMLLAAAFLMFRGFRQSFDEGIVSTKNRLLMARFDPRLVQYDGAQTQQFYRRLVERTRELTGVESVGLTQNPPLGLDSFGVVAFVPEGFQMPVDRESFTSAMDTVDEGFFETMGVPILRGRGFRESDTAEAPRVAIVNDQFAKHYWPEGDALGKRIRLDRSTGTPVEIVGVARTVKYEQTTERPTDFVYLPLSQNPAARMLLLLRTNGDPLQLLEPLKRSVRTLDANLPISETRTYADLYRYHTVEGPAVAFEMVGTLGLVGLVLAIAGLYGVVAYNVSRRTREIGIRIAIGASPGNVLRLMMSKGLTLVGIGTVIGLTLGVAVERLMNSMLFNAGGVDLLVYLTVVPTMLLVTMLAAYVPARKASHIAPTVALRHE